MDQRGAAPRRADLLAILDAGPIDPGALTFLSRQRQKRAQDGIDALIAALDAIDGDPDLEPTMAGGNGMGQLDECEPDVDDELSGDENEPSLGAPENPHDQRRWGQGQYSREHDHDDTFLDVGGWEVRRGLERVRCETEDMLRRNGLTTGTGSLPVAFHPDMLPYLMVAS